MFYLLPVVLVTTFVVHAIAGDIKPHFIQSGLVPDILPSFTPKAELHVSFGSAAQAKAVKAGAVLEPHQVLDPPKWSLTSKTEDFAAPSFIPRVFTALLIDIDTKTLHYLEGDFDERSVNNGRASVPYASLKPVSRSRYALLVYEQNTLPNSDKDFSAKVSDEFGGALNTQQFDVVAFAKRMGMTGPIAATVFSVSPDQSDFGLNAAAAVFKTQATMSNIAAVTAVVIGVYALSRLRFFRSFRASRRE